MTERDLLDSLAAFTGGESDEAGRQRLVEMIRTDPALRRALAAELAMIGRLRAVQTPEPRWLRLHDEIGGAAGRKDDFERRVMERAGTGFRRTPRGLMIPAMAAAVLALAAVAWLMLRGGPARTPPSVPHVAAVTAVEDAAWDGAYSLRPGPGQGVSAGRLRFLSGRVTLAFLSGAVLAAEGPAEIDLLSPDRVSCRFGRLRVRAPRGSEGFTVSAPGYAVVDLGTEFGLDVPREGPSRLAVFEGKAELSLLKEDGSTVKSALVGPRTALEIDPATGSLRAVEMGAFPEPPASPSWPMPSAPGHDDLIKASRPWGYWRFDGPEGDLFRNETDGGFPFRRIGAVRPAGGALSFEPGKGEAYLELDGVIRAIGKSKSLFCRACFDGHYPIPVPQKVKLTKFILEDAKPTCGVHVHQKEDTMALRGPDPPADDSGG